MQEQCFWLHCLHCRIACCLHHLRISIDPARRYAYRLVEHARHQTRVLRLLVEGNSSVTTRIADVSKIASEVEDAGKLRRLPR
jgi:hypothetical protein